MRNEKQTPVGTRARAVRPPRGGWRWPVIGLVLALFVSVAVSTARAQQAPPLLPEEKKCSDTTPDNRPCTATEEAWFCVENAMDAYDECKAENGFFGDGLCYVSYSVDFWACNVELLGYPLKKVFK